MRKRQHVDHNGGNDTMEMEVGDAGTHALSTWCCIELIQPLDAQIETSLASFLSVSPQPEVTQLAESTAELLVKYEGNEE